MEIETIDDICNEVADKIGVYGACKAAEQGKDSCEEECYTCCRVGFMLTMPERIRMAFANELKLAEIGMLSDEVLAHHEPYNLKEILLRLTHATEILLYKKDYDGPDYEEMNQSVKRAKVTIALLDANLKAKLT